MPKLGDAYIDLRPNWGPFDREVAVKMRALGKGVDLDPRAVRGMDRYGKSIRTARQEADSLAASTSNIGVDRAAVRNTDRLGISLGRARGHSEGLHGSLLRAKLVLGALAVPPIAQGLSAAAAGAVALTSALSPLAGTLAAIPGGLSLLVQGVGTAKFAAGDLAEALGGNQAALKRLNPEARRFYDRMQLLRPEVERLRDAAGRGLFAGVGRGIDEASRNLPVLNRILEQTGGELGGVAQKAGELVGSRAFGRDLGIIGQRNARYIGELGDGSLHLASALRHLMVAAGPFTDWLVDTATGWTENLEAQAEAGRRTGETAAYLERTRAVMERLGSVGSNLAGAFRAIGRAATPLGDDMWRSIDRGTARFEDWAESARGQNSLRDWFEDARHTGRELAGAVNEVSDRFQELRREGRSAFDALAITGSEAFARFLSAAAERIAREAPSIAEGFVRGFFAANIWGKVAIGAYLLTKFRLWPALFAKMGARNGAAFAGGFATTSAAAAAAAPRTPIYGPKGQVLKEVVPAAATGPAARARTGARVGGFIRGLGPFAKSAGMIGLGFAAIDGLGAAFSSQYGRTSLGEKIGLAFQQTASTVSFGLFPGPREVDERLQTIVSKINAYRGTKLALNRPGDSDNSIIRKEDLADFDARSRAMLARLARLRNEANRYFAPGIDIKVTARPGDFARVRNEFGRLRSGAVISLKDINQATSDNFTRISRSMDVHSTAGRRAVATNFRLGLQAIRRSMADGSISTREGMTGMRRLLALQSGLGKDQLGRNFNAIERHIARTMSRGGKLTEQGMKFMRAVMVNEMEALGLSKDSIRMSLNKKASAKKGFTQPGARGGLVADIASGVRNYAAGGMVQFGRAGQAGRDSIPVNFGGQRIVVAPGEQGVVLNRHQQADLNARTADVGGLRGFFAKHDRPHYMARGGYVQGAQEPSGSAGAGIRELNEKLFRRGFSATSGGEYRGTGTFHDRQMASDYGDSVNSLPKLWGILLPIRRQLAELFGPAHFKPAPSFDFGVPRGFEPGHDDHIHVAVASAIAGALGKGGAGGAFEKLQRVLVQGPDSAMKSIIQGRLDQYRAAANMRGEQLAAQFAPATAGVTGLGAGVGAGKGAASRAQMVRWATMALHATGHGASPVAIGKILELAMKESSWIVDSINLWDSNARAGNPSGGLMHVTLDKVGGSKANLFDPVKNMIASINYQFSEYGGLITHSPYALGGLVGGDGPSIADFFQTGGTVGGRDRGSRSGRVTPLRLKQPKRDKWDPKGVELTRNIKRFDELAKFIEDQQSLLGSDQQFFQLDDVLSQDELDKLVGRAGGIRDAIASQLNLVRDAILPDTKKKAHAFTKLVERRVKRTKDLVRKVKNAREESARIAKAEARAQEAFNRKRNPTRQERQARRRDRERNTKRRAGLAENVRGYQNELERLTGERSPDVRKLSQVPEDSLLGAATSKRDEYRTAITESPGWEDMLRASRLPAQLRDAEYNVAELIKTGATKPDSSIEQARAEALAQLLREANLRTAVSERQFGVFRGWDRELPRFHTGGIVPGSANQEVTAVLRGREGVFTEDQMNALGQGAGAGDGPRVRVVVEDHRTRVFVDDVERAVEQVTRRQARGASRALPGRGGGIQR